MNKEIGKLAANRFIRLFDIVRKVGRSHILPSNEAVADNNLTDTLLFLGYKDELFYGGNKS